MIINPDNEVVEKLTAAIDADRERRVDQMPTETDALRVMHRAYQRLCELGWKDAIYCPKDGTPFEIIEAGSTGIFEAHYEGEWPTGSWWAVDGGDLWPSRPTLFRLKRTAGEDVDAPPDQPVGEARTDGAGGDDRQRPNPDQSDLLSRLQSAERDRDALKAELLETELKAFFGGAASCLTLEEQKAGPRRLFCENSGVWIEFPDDATYWREVARRTQQRADALKAELTGWSRSVVETAEHTLADIGERGSCSVQATAEDESRMWAYRRGYQVGRREATKDVAAILSRAPQPTGGDHGE